MWSLDSAGHAAPGEDVSIPRGCQSRPTSFLVACRRPFFLTFVFACVVSLAATGTLTARIAAPALLIWVYVPAVEALALYVVIRTHRDRLPLARARRPLFCGARRLDATAVVGSSVSSPFVRRGAGGCFWRAWRWPAWRSRCLVGLYRFLLFPARGGHRPRGRGEVARPARDDLVRRVLEFRGARAHAQGVGARVSEAVAECAVIRRASRSRGAARRGGPRRLGHRRGASVNGADGRRIPLLGADFHVHMFPLGWSTLAPWDALIEARHQGLDVIALVPHNIVWLAKVGRWL